MEATTAKRSFIKDLSGSLQHEVLIRGWVYRLRVLAKTTFIIVRDCSGDDDILSRIPIHWRRNLVFAGQLK